MQIAGVDFSGAKTDSNTWLALGEWDGAALVLDSCRRVRRRELAETLGELPGGSVAALDFPFSVPQSFADFWVPTATAMPDLWAAASAIELTRFLALRDEFVGQFGEVKRLCDTRFPECYSCLHKANPNMVPMTFYGMQMLGPLWQAGCAVPPLNPTSQEPADPGKALLLEAMPGAALKAMKLPYKGYKKGLTALELRKAILEGLETRSGIKLRNLAAFQETCLMNDDALDSVVAAVVAALWAKDESLFWSPTLETSLNETTHPTEAVALLEGWLYAPVNL